MKADLDSALSASARATGILTHVLVVHKVTRRRLIKARDRLVEATKILNKLLRQPNEGDPTDEPTIPTT